jgi:uncharacterized protein YjbI with pentapeptide repeats
MNPPDADRPPQDQGAGIVQVYDDLVAARDRTRLLSAQGFCPSPPDESELPLGWKRPLAHLERAMESSLGWLNRWAFLDLLQRLATLGIAVGAVQFVISLPKQREQAAKTAESARRSAHYAAWQVINSAEGKGGSGGRIDALQDLVNDRVSLQGVRLDSARLGYIKLQGADLDRASLRGTFLWGADLQGASLSDAHLEGAELSTASLKNAYLVRANLRGAFLRGANLEHAALDNADLTGAVLHPLSGPGITQWSDLRWATLQASRLEEIDLTLAHLEFASLTGSNLRGAKLWGANLWGAYLGGTDLEGATLGGQSIAGTIVVDSEVYIQNWRQIKSLEGANISGVLGAPPGFLRWALDTMGAVER